MANTPAGRLYVVATPIGNLADLSPRARAMLESCTLIAAEDTRHTGAMLRHFGISRPLVALHDHNEQQRAPELVRELSRGAQIALVSDAGTPAISDPGYDLVCAAAAAGIEILAIPGPCAAVAALSIAALPTDRFCFEGFLPARGAAAAREITKLHETVYRGTLGALAVRARGDPDFRRGEIVVVVAGAAPAPATGAADVLDRLLGILMAELPLKQAARLAARIAGARDNEVYKRALKLKPQD